MASVSAAAAAGDAKRRRCLEGEALARTPSPPQPLAAAAATEAVAGVHACGPWPLDRVSVEVQDGIKEFSKEVIDVAQRHWDQELARKPKMFDGPVWCLLSYDVTRLPRAAKVADAPMGNEAGVGSDEEGHLQLRVQRSSFKFVLYTHLSEEGRSLPPAERAGACGLMALTQTEDGYLVFGQRSMSLACMPGYWHCVPAGQVDSPDFKQVLQKELLEETGTDWDAVKHIRLLALMDTGAEQGHKFELVFWIQLSLGAEELFRSYQSAEDRYEHERLIFVCPPKAHDRQRSARAEVSPTAKESLGGGLAATSFPHVELHAFLDGEFVLTDISRRGLRLWSELKIPAPA